MATVHVSIFPSCYTPFMPPVSIIIPTLNEEFYLPLLLDSLRLITSPLDIIVVDGDSSDKTCEVAEKYMQYFSGTSSLRLLHSPVKRISTQRNLGAREAKHDIFIFCDADVVVPSKEAFENVVTEFVQKKYVVAGPRAVPSESHIHLAIVYRSALLAQKVLHKIKRPFFGGFFLMTRKEVFVTCIGFNEELRIGEDVDYSTRAAQHGQFGVLKTYVYVSGRRAIKYGYSWIFKDFKEVIRLARTGKISDTFFYPFGDYGEAHQSHTSKEK
jgi:glycosyltransferase involved in cell wall biosynthesis